MTRDSQKFELLKKRKIIAGCCFLVIIFFITLLKGGVIFPAEPEILVREETPISKEQDGSKEETPQIVIDVSGAVNRPGILILPEGSRVYEALEAAGGTGPEGDLRDINQAAELLDGEKLHIPSSKDYEPEQSADGNEPVASTGTGKTSTGTNALTKKININTADSAELQTLKGVGPATASRILEYRKEKGRFKNIEELKNVKGIGDKTFEKFKDGISVT